MLTLANPETLFKVQPLPLRCERISWPRSMTDRIGPYKELLSCFAAAKFSSYGKTHTIITVFR